MTTIIGKILSLNTKEGMAYGEIEFPPIYDDRDGKELRNKFPLSFKVGTPEGKALYNTLSSRIGSEVKLEGTSTRRNYLPEYLIEKFIE